MIEGNNDYAHEKLFSIKKIRFGIFSEFGHHLLHYPHTLSFTGQETEDLGRPGTRRRSNSDSNLYFKARDGDIGKGKKEPKIYLEETKYLDSEKEAFVQSYLQNIRETHSMVTETSDSGITTHGAPSDLDEMEDVSAGKYNLLFASRTFFTIIYQKGGR